MTFVLIYYFCAICVNHFLTRNKLVKPLRNQLQIGNHFFSNELIVWFEIFSFYISVKISLIYFQWSERDWKLRLTCCDRRNLFHLVDSTEDTLSLCILCGRFLLALSKIERSWDWFTEICLNVRIVELFGDVSVSEPELKLCCALIGWDV